MANRFTDLTLRVPGSRLVGHAFVVFVLWVILSRLNMIVDAQLSYYLALAAMYVTAMFGMTILVGLSGQVSLGNGALMAIGGYVFALTSMHWSTVPIIGVPWNAVWSMIFAGIGGVVAGLIIGALGARLRGPYLAGLTLGIAVGVPAIVNRFPGLLGGDEGLKLIVPYPEGGYTAAGEVKEEAQYDDSGLDEFFIDEQADVPVTDESQLAADDLLTVDDAQSGVAADDLLTVDDAQSGVAADDLLTVDDAQSGVTDSVIEPSEVVPSVVEDPADAFRDPISQASDFVLQQWQASVAIAVACIVGFLALNMVRGRQGRVWQAVRDDPVAAAVVGIAPAQSKVSAFVVSSLFAALAGAVLAQILTFVGPGAFGLGLSLSLLVGVVLGGRMSLIGAVIGALLIVWLPEWVDSFSVGMGLPASVSDNAPNFLYGLLVVAVVLVAPGGLTGTASQLWHRIRAKS